MSRIGKKPIDIPQGTKLDVQGPVVTLKGPQGELSYTLPESVSVTVENGKLVVGRASDSKTDRSLHGLARSILMNMVTGVSQGYKRVLSITGVGYRAQSKGRTLAFTLGYSHPVEYALPEGITATVDDKMTTITLAGFDKQLLGQTAANIRKLRAPDVYKGKGVRYSGERLKLKAGKTGKK
jgi:large subunit ribosomal protein L6